MATRPLLLDLFCGAGGAATGYHRAGFQVIGVDIRYQAHYSFEFYRGEWEKFGKLLLAQYRFDAIHASPPCQRYSDLAKRNGNANDHPDFIDAVREMLRATQLPYVIENVEGAPLWDPIVLCGSMFGLRVIRHRLFESNVPLSTPAHPQHKLVYTRDKRKAHYGKLDEMTSPVMVNGGGNCSIAAARDAMGIDWMTKAELNEAIPPAYTEFIGKQLRAAIASATQMKSAGTIAPCHDDAAGGSQI